jgi:peptide/nickel transport system ATP-binding protein
VKPVLDVHELSVRFRTAEGPARAVEEATFTLYPEETLALIGETGCGKSMVALALVGLTPSGASVDGRIYFRERDITAAGRKEMETIRRREIALILQNPQLALNPVYPVRRQLMESLRGGKKTNMSTAADEISEILEAFGFQNPGAVLKLYPHQLSGGMAQRILTAAAVLRKPSLLIADEPTKGLDGALREKVIQALITAGNLHSSAVLLITHDLQTALRTADRIAVMYAGEIIETGPSGDFFKKPLHPYSRLLLESLPENGFRPTEGISPPLSSLPRGCRFHPRCPSAREICHRQRPAIAQNEKRKVRCILYS